MKLRLHDKVAIAVALVDLLLFAYAYLFTVQALLFVGFALLTAVGAFYCVWQFRIYLKDTKNKLEFVFLIVSWVLTLVVIFLSIMCYSGKWFGV